MPIGKAVFLRPRYVWSSWLLARGRSGTLLIHGVAPGPRQGYDSWVWQGKASVENVVSKILYWGKRACVSICSVALGKSVHLSTWGRVTGPPNCNTWELCLPFQRRTHESIWGAHPELKSGCSVNHSCPLTGCAVDEPPQPLVLYLIYLKRLPKSWLEAVISRLLDRNQIIVRSEGTEGCMSVFWEILHSQITAGVKIFIFF